MKKILFVLLALSIVSSVFAGGQSEEGADQPVYITLGTSSVGGSYYLYGGGVASYINSNLKGIIVTAETTRGSGENAVMLGERLDLAFINGNITWASRANDGRTNARAVMSVDIAPTHWVTMAKSGITKIEDVVGKKISIGAPGSGAETSAIAILQAYGIWEQVEPNAQRLGHGESATALKDGHIAAFSGGSAVPFPAVAELAALDKIRILDVSDEAMVNLGKTNPPYIRWIIPAGTYDGIDTPVRTYGVPSCLLADESVPDEVVYQIVKTLYTPEAVKYMKNVYFAWEPIPNKEFFDQIGVPMHPGALKYYKEVGLIK